MTLHYRRDGTPYPEGEKGTIEWALDFDNDKLRTVAFDEIPGRYGVSTVWLGLDHGFLEKGGPLIFETMVFDDFRHGVDQERYRTEEEAVRGHAEVLKKWRARNSNLFVRVGSFFRRWLWRVPENLLWRVGRWRWRRARNRARASLLRDFNEKGPHGHNTVR